MSLTNRYNGNLHTVLVEKLPHEKISQYFSRKLAILTMNLSLCRIRTQK